MQQKLVNSALAAVFVTIFIDLVGFGLIIPVLPLLFRNPDNVNYLLPQGTSSYQELIVYGLLLGMFPLVQFFATPIFGQLSDHFGRKKILLFALFGSFLSYSIFAIGVATKNLPLLFLARAFGGLTSGNIAVAQAVVADVSTPQTSVKNFGLIGGAFGLGLILGPFFGGHLVSLVGVVLLFWIVASIDLLNILFVYIFLPETCQKKIDGEISKINWSKSIGEIFLAFKLQHLRLFLLTSFLYQAGFTFLTTFANPFFIDRFGWKEQQIGNFFGYIGIWLVITQAIIIRFTLSFDQKKVLSAGLLFSAIFAGGLLIPTQEIWLYIIAPFFAIFVGLTNANITSTISNLGDSKKQGEAIGINSSIQALAQAIPPIISGFITFGSVAVPIWISVVTILFSWIVFIKIPKKI